MRIALTTAACICVLGLLGCEGEADDGSAEETGGGQETACPAECAGIYDVSKLQDEAVAIDEEATASAVEIAPPDGAACAVPACDALAAEYQTMQLENESANDQLNAAKDAALQAQVAADPFITVREINANVKLLHFTIEKSATGGCDWSNPMAGWSGGSYAVLKEIHTKTDGTAVSIIPQTPDPGENCLYVTYTTATKTVELIVMRF